MLRLRHLIATLVLAMALAGCATITPSSGTVTVPIEIPPAEYAE